MVDEGGLAEVLRAARSSVRFYTPKGVSEDASHTDSHTATGVSCRHAVA